MYLRDVAFRMQGDRAHLVRLNETLLRLQRSVASKFQGSTDATIAARVAKLGDRLAVVQLKMRAAFGKDDPLLPENLRTLRKLADLDADDAPPEFICPISQALMVDPVATTDGNIYDRPSILEWFATFSDARAPTSPLTNLALDSRDLTPQTALRKQIQDFMERAIGAPKRSDDENAAPVSGVPIWSSSVVPASEERSRELNLLRVHDGELAVRVQPTRVPLTSKTLVAQSRPTRNRAIAAAQMERLRTSGMPAMATPSAPVMARVPRELYTFIPSQNDRAKSGAARR